MKSRYPETFSDIPSWASTNGVPASEARKRFAQGAILRAIATSQRLRQTLVFKGGNALDFVWQPNRSTADLDFSSYNAELTADELKQLLGAALEAVGRKLGIACRVHRVDRNPPGPDRTFVTFEARVGYALSDDARNLAALAAGRSSIEVIPVEVSINEPICSTEDVDFRAPQPLQVSTLEDIIAEKLRALLQQPIRRRQRHQDLLDIAVALEIGATLDRARVARFLQEKAAARHVAVSKSAFSDEKVKELAQKDYDTLKSFARERFVTFDAAYALLMRFVDELPIPP